MRTIKTLCLISVVLSILFSCKKDSAHKAGTCRIVATYDTIWSDQGVSISSNHLSYDNEGRIAYEVINWPTETVARVFAYKDSMTVVTPTTDRMSIDTIWLNGKKQPIKLNVTFPGVSTYTATYAYDALSQLQSSVGWNVPNAKTNVAYTFVNGDCTSATTANGDVTSYTYYTDKPARDGGGNAFSDYFTYGVVIIKNAHLLKSLQFDKSIWDYTYTFDQDGKITSMTERSGSQVNKSAYEYDCSQQ